MDLIPYDPTRIGKGQGFVNLGATCYHNSLLQCLLSCSSIFQVLEHNETTDQVRKNPLAQNMLALYRVAQAGGDISRMCIPIWQNIIGIARGRRDHVVMDSGQQDAHEGLMMFLDIVDAIPDVRRLFEHRHKVKIYCDACRKCVVDRNEVNLAFEVQPTLRTEQNEKFANIDEFYGVEMSLNDFLRKQNTFADENFICPECKTRGVKFRTTTLTMVPEILPILIKKYDSKRVTPFPERLTFMAMGKKHKIIYRLVAQSEHSGNMQGGHYWAVCLRSNGWCVLNDLSSSSGTPGPTLNSYVLFYHFEKTEQVE